MVIETVSIYFGIWYIYHTLTRFLEIISCPFFYFFCLSLNIISYQASMTLNYDLIFILKSDLKFWLLIFYICADFYHIFSSSNKIKSHYLRYAFKNVIRSRFEPWIWDYLTVLNIISLCLFLKIIWERERERANDPRMFPIDKQNSSNVTISIFLQYNYNFQVIRLIINPTQLWAYIDIEQINIYPMVNNKR